MNLVIVESPAKGRTIERYLGKDYKVLASFGHVRDLPRKTLGVDVKKGCEPEYVLIPKAKKVIALLKKESEKAEKTVLATDFDREGEAIAWHLSHILHPKAKKKLQRITFTEITEEAIKNSIKKPRSLDMNLVDSQQARRILDRLVGYKLSPLLWKKVAPGLSAGRVQSVAVRLVVEREREIENFKKEEFWKIIARLSKKDDKKEFIALLYSKDDKTLDKLAIKNEKEAKQVLYDLKNSDYIVKNVQKEEALRHPFAPFITSTLQQEAFRRFGYTAKKTMFLAQQLYEKGYISYHRTDSTNLSTLAQSAARKYIKENLGDKYLPEKPNFYKTKVLKAQEAHEAIRPTHIERAKFEDKELETSHQTIYELIWRRTVASQMTPARLNVEKIDINAKNYTFRAEGQILKFDGFFKVYPVSVTENILPPLTISEKLNLIDLQKEQDFTRPPARYTEASLIKALEKEGIGRPSTYAPILSTVQSRGYVGKAKQYLFPKEIGMIVNDLLAKNFPDVVDLQFTAKMEKSLDKIAEGDEKYQKVCEDFWKPFSKNLKEKEEELKKSEITEEKTDKKCEKCGSPMIIKLGRYGRFLACSNYPECKNTKALIRDTGKKCPKCQKADIVERKNKRGQIFYGCSRYPKCDYASSSLEE